MSTSDDGVYTRFDESLLDDADFCDAGMLNRAIGNLNHLADQVSQNRVKWILGAGVGAYEVDSTLTPGTDSYFSDEGPINMLWRSGPFDLHMRQSGETNRCRVRVHFESEDATHTATLRATLAPLGFAEIGIGDVTGVNTVQSDARAATTPTWFDMANLIYLDREWVRRARESVSSVDTIGGEDVLVTWMRVELVIASSISNASAVAKLSGCELTEYLEP